MQSFRSLIYNRYTDFTPVTYASGAEVSLLSGGSQPVLWHPALDFTQVGRQFILNAKGVLSTTSTPTFTFLVRIGNLAANGGANITGAILGTSYAITCGSGVTNVPWELQLEFILTSTIGIGSGNTTLSTFGWVESPGGFTTINSVSCVKGSLIPSTGALTTWTQTCDNSIDNYINLSAACGSGSSSNAITVKRLTMEALN